MKIKDLKPKQGNVEIILDIEDKGDIRTFEKFGKTGKVCTVKATDGIDTINVSLWNEQVDMVNKGDRIKIENGYVNEYQGELQLTSGRFGKLELVNKDESSTETQTTDEGEHVLSEDEKTEADVEEYEDKPASEEDLSDDEYVENIEEEVLDDDREQDPDK